MATHTPLDSNSLDHIARLYNCKMRLDRPIVEGNSNSNYRIIITTPQGNTPAVLTIHETPDKVSTVRPLHDTERLIHFMGFLSEASAETGQKLFPLLRKNTAGDVYCKLSFAGVTKCVSIADYIDGKHMAPQTARGFSTTQCQKVGTLMARFHRISASYPHPETIENPCAPNRLRPLLERYATAPQYNRISEALTDIEAHWQQQIQTLPKGVMHGDLFPENLLVKGRDTKIIDFGEAGHGLLLYDAAIAAFAFAKTDGKLDMEKANALLKGYCQEMELSVREQHNYKKLFPFMIEAAAVRFAVSRLHYVALGRDLSPDEAIEIYDEAHKHAQSTSPQLLP